MQPYQDVYYQDVYYVAESFEEAREQLRNYVARHLPRKFEVFYDANTQRVHVLDGLDKLDALALNVDSNMTRLANAIKLLKLTKN